MKKNLTLQERRPQAMRAIPTSHTERIYVKVTSDFDSTGYMQPTSITWTDGRTFPIDAVRDFRPAGAANNDFSGDCFTVLIQGQEKHLFFEHIDRRFSGRDRKSTRLNSSHVSISYAVFCLKKKRYET